MRTWRDIDAEKCNNRDDEDKKNKGGRVRLIDRSLKT